MSKAVANLSTLLYSDSHEMASLSQNSGYSQNVNRFNEDAVLKNAINRLNLGHKNRS